jgi:hypothetical protein
VEFEMMIARMDAHEDSNSNLHSQITVLLVDSFTEALVAFLSINNFHYPDGREYGSAYLSELYDFRPHLPQVEVDPYFNLPADLKKICR